MKPKIIIAGLLTAAIAVLGAAGCASDQKAQAALMALSKISKQQAEEAALAKAPGGVIKEGGLDDESGNLIWWFEIVTPGSKSLTEVSVDAITGGVISVAIETPESAAKEKD